MLKKRVLILTGKAGSGHLTVAQAYQYWLTKWGYEAWVLDVLPPINEKINNWLYKVPKTYKQLFAFSNNKAWARLVTLPSKMEIERRIRKLAPDYKSADMIISTHPLIHPTWGKKRVMTLMDPIVHAVYLVLPRAQHYISFWKDCEGNTKGFGIAAKRVSYTGPLARPLFYENARNLRKNHYKGECKKTLGIAPETTLVLVMAGQAWIYRAAEYLQYFKNIFRKENVIFAFMCGKNKDFAQQMSSKYRRVKMFKILNWLSEEEVCRWMAAADFGVAFSLAQMAVEAGLSKLPIYIFRLIEGQEEGYRAVIEDNGVGMYVPGEPQNQVEILKVLYKHTQTMFGKNLVNWQKELLEAPNRVKKVLEKI